MANDTVQTISFRLATDEDTHLPTYDNTKLQAINVCPVWGIVRYQMHKSPRYSGRALALEAGSAMHEVFAWVRLCTLGQASQGALGYHGARLFGQKRWLEITKDVRDFRTLDGCKSGAITVLNTSGYYDDPRDKRRTLSNLEECALAYIDRWRFDQPVWRRDQHDDTADVGIEIPFDIVCDLVTAVSSRQFRFTGKIDGIHQHHDRLAVHENKTAARLNEAWHMSFHTSSQITGYCIAASVYSGEQIKVADVLGLSVPMPRSYEYGGFIRDSFIRHDYHFERWAHWLNNTVAMYELYADNPYEAPQYTHSCNRYYRPCSLIPFCDNNSDEQHAAIDEMITVEWSPLHGLVEKMADGNEA